MGRKLYGESTQIKSATTAVASKVPRACTRGLVTKAAVEARGNSERPYNTEPEVGEGSKKKKEKKKKKARVTTAAGMKGKSLPREKLCGLPQPGALSGGGCIGVYTAIGKLGNDLRGWWKPHLGARTRHVLARKGEERDREGRSLNELARALPACQCRASLLGGRLRG